MLSMIGARSGIPGHPLNHLLCCRAYLGRTPPALGGRELPGLVTQTVGLQGHFTSAVNAPPAEKDSESARGVNVQPPVTEKYKAAKAFEAKFEGWR